MKKDIRKTIAQEVYESGWLSKQCRSVCGNNKPLADDLQQEILLIILEYKPNSTLEKAYSKDEHLPLIRRIINNQYYSNTSAFYFKYKANNFVELNEEITQSIYNEEDNYNL